MNEYLCVQLKCSNMKLSHSNNTQQNRYRGTNIGYYSWSVCMFEFTQGMGWLTAPARHEKWLPGWKCEDTAGSCHKPQSSAEPSSPVGGFHDDQKRKKKKTKQNNNVKLLDIRTHTHSATTAIDMHTWTIPAQNNTILTFSKNIVSVLVLCLLTSDMPWSFPIILGFFCKDVNNIKTLWLLQVLKNVLLLKNGKCSNRRECCHSEVC